MVFRPSAAAGASSVSGDEGLFERGYEALVAFCPLTDASS
jgi:hypothetical protein